MSSRWACKAGSDPPSEPPAVAAGGGKFWLGPQAGGRRRGSSGTQSVRKRGVAKTQEAGRANDSGPTSAQPSGPPPHPPPPTPHPTPPHTQTQTHTFWDIQQLVCSPGARRRRRALLLSQAHPAFLRLALRLQPTIQHGALQLQRSRGRGNAARRRHSLTGPMHEPAGVGWRRRRRHQGCRHGMAGPAQRGVAGRGQRSTARHAACQLGADGRWPEDASGAQHGTARHSMAQHGTA